MKFSRIEKGGVRRGVGENGELSVHHMWEQSLQIHKIKETNQITVC
jgi:hypothetical protein